MKMTQKITAFQFDATQHNPSQTFDVLPVGWYVAKVVDADIRPTKAPGGQYIAATFEIVAPEFAAGRKVWANYNIVNANATAQEIGQNEFAALTLAAGTPQISDLQQVFERPIYIKLKITKQDGQEDRNEVSGYKSTQEQVKLVDKPNAPAGMPQAAGFAPAPGGFPQQPTQPMQQPQQYAPASGPAQGFNPAPQQVVQQPQVAPQQPQQAWNQPQQPVQQQAPAQQPVQQPWNATPAQQAPVEQPVQQPQPVTQPQQQQAAVNSAAPWAQQQVDSQGNAAANTAQPQQQQAQQPQEPAHPAQAAQAPWQTGAQPAATGTAPWNTPAQQ